MAKIEEPLDRVGLFMVRQAPGLLEPGRMDAVATTILLLKNVNFRVFSATLKGLRKGRLRIDAGLVSDLYKACPPRLKPAFAGSPVLALLEPEDFHPLFEDAYAREMSAIERRNLASVLSVFLRWKPQQAPRYRKLILELMRSREQEPCLIALGLSAYIQDLGQEDLEILERKLRVRFSQHRCSALYAFYKLMRQHRTVAPHVLAFCTSARVIGKIRKLRREDPEEDVRIYARQALGAYGKLPRARRRP